MPELFTALEPGPDALPTRLASPFDHRPPHPLAQRAAEALQGRLERGELAADCRLQDLEDRGGGKMFGVLVVAAQGRVGYLAAFSGMLGGRWEVAGFAPPLFDLPERDAFWPAGEAELDALEVQHRTLVDGPEASALRARLAELGRGQAAARAELDVRHQARKAIRRQARGALEPGGQVASAALHGLAQESRGDAAERRRLEASQRLERAELEARQGELNGQRLALERHRADRSRQLWHQLCSGYALQNARGERRSLVDLFGAEAAPGGAGDCAAPKLFGLAYRLGLEPLALAEFWRGAPPLTGGRLAGVYYPACRRKCGVVLPFMLDGLAVDPAPLHGEGGIADDEPRVVHEDAWIVVVEKPVGLLSVPGRQARLRDSVLLRLRARYPAASGAMIVHRLDLDTSGLLLAAKDPETHAALQAQFSRREVEKRYAAVLEGEVVGDEGVIALPLRVDLDDRPRQIVDPVHGRSAVTRWQVISRAGARTRVALFPHTGRTHQLRVHAAHPLGLGSPIVGDRLYGRDGVRLLLHAESLSFQHPHTGKRIELTSAPPF